MGAIVALVVIFAGGAACLPRTQGGGRGLPLQGCVRSWLASWGVQADTVALQMLLLKTPQVGWLRKDEAWNLLLTCWQVAVVPPGGERCSVYGRPRTENVCFGLAYSTLLILGLLTVPDLCKQLQQMWLSHQKGSSISKERLAAITFRKSKLGSTAAPSPLPRSVPIAGPMFTF